MLGGATTTPNRSGTVGGIDIGGMTQGGTDTTIPTATTVRTPDRVPTGTTLAGTDDASNIACVTFNCKSFKRNADYIVDLLQSCDLLFLCETWLRPGELCMIQALIDSHPDLQNSAYGVIAKSSMEEDAGRYAGRPYGGLAVIYKKNSSYNVKELDCDSDRVITCGIFDHSDKMLSVLCHVYMPCYEPGNSLNTDCFIQCVDSMQSFVDTYSARCPVFFLGDFNVQLPASSSLNASWYKGIGFSKHSKMLHDFMNENSYACADLCFSQAVQYTYFCHARNIFTWIDHVLCPMHLLSRFTKCCISPPHPDNDSDHLPVQMLFSLSTASLAASVDSRDGRATAPGIPQLRDTTTKQHFQEMLKQKLRGIEKLELEMSRTEDPGRLQWKLDEQLSTIREAIAESAIAASNPHSRHFRPKPYWSPDLSRLRDKKRFWWRVWTDCGRPRHGEVYNSYKLAKKQYRRLSRERITALMNGSLNKLNELFHAGKLTAFWKQVKRTCKMEVRSDLQAESFAKHYGTVMTAQNITSADGRSVVRSISAWEEQLAAMSHPVATVSEAEVSRLIDSLRSNSAPGLDGITSDHLKAGKSILCSLLANALSAMLTWCVVPTSFCVGLIVPVLKKPGLNPNDVANYRPVTLSTTISKLLERLMVPEDDVTDTQFGFRKGMGTAFACTLLNDVMQYFKMKKSPLYTCSLDAEKCFDSICHNALFFKLHDKIPAAHWLTLKRWYSGLKAAVKWRKTTSDLFVVSRGTRQGSVLSPHLFNIFIDGLLSELRNCPEQVRIGPCQMNSFAYADDITVMSTSVPGLQTLVNMCSAYADKWNFKFGLKKTKCMVTAPARFSREPTVTLKGQPIEVVDSLEVLGVQFGSSDAHVSNRAAKCRRAFHGLRSLGLPYPGCDTQVKRYLLRSICQPVLLYGAETIALPAQSLQFLKTSFNNLVKRSLGFNTRSRSSMILNAMNLPCVTDLIMHSTSALLHRIFNVPSPVRDLCSFFLSMFLIDGFRCPGTLIDRLLNFNVSPTRCVFIKPRFYSNRECDGIVDSLRFLISSEHFLKPYADEHIVAVLMTKSF